MCHSVCVSLCVTLSPRVGGSQLSKELPVATGSVAVFIIRYKYLYDKHIIYCCTALVSIVHDIVIVGHEMSKLKEHCTCQDGLPLIHMQFYYCY